MDLESWMCIVGKWMSSFPSAQGFVGPCCTPLTFLWKQFFNSNSVWLYPQSAVGQLINYFRFSAVSCFSFVCLPASCRSCSLYVARHAFKNKAGNVLDKQTKSAQAITAELGIKTRLFYALKSIAMRFCMPFSPFLCPCILFYMAERLYHIRKNCVLGQCFKLKNFALSCIRTIFALVWQSNKRQLESAYAPICANRANIRCLFITTTSPQWTSLWWYLKSCSSSRTRRPRPWCLPYIEVIRPLWAFIATMWPCRKWVRPQTWHAMLATRYV